MNKNSQNRRTDKQSDTSKNGGLIVKKLPPELRRAAIKMFGALMSPAEVKASFLKHYGMDVSHQSLYNMQASIKYVYKIDEEKQKYLSKLEEVPIFHPKVRFQRFENLYNDGLEKNDTHQMVDALRLAQNEFKEKIGGDTYNVYSQNNQFNMEMTMEEIELRKQEIFRKLKNKELLNGPSGQTGQDIGK